MVEDGVEGWAEGGAKSWVVTWTEGRAEDWAGGWAKCWADEKVEGWAKGWADGWAAVMDGGRAMRRRVTLWCEAVCVVRDGCMTSRAFPVEGAGPGRDSML